MKRELVDYAEVMRCVSTLERTDLAQISVLGRSILGREIPVITLGRGKNAVLYVGGHRGTESVCCGLLLDFLTDYVKEYEKKNRVFEYPMSYLYEQRRVIVIPMLNPDGAEYVCHSVGDDNPLRDRVLRMNGGDDFSAWQANARGVDLSHNYDAGFFEYRQSGMRTDGVISLGGEFPESEPETAALCRMLRFRREEIVGVLSLGTGSGEIYCCCADNLTAKTISVARVLSRFTGYRLFRPEELRPIGSLTDWCISSLGRPAFTVQCGTAEGCDRRLTYERLRRVLFSFSCIV